MPTLVEYGHDISGTTANRLAVQNADPGCRFFDLTLGQLFVWTGLAWLAVPLTPLPQSQFVSSPTMNATANPGEMSGAQSCFLNLTSNAVNQNFYTTRSGAQLFSDIANCFVGLAYDLRIIFTGAGQLVLVGGQGVTFKGTTTIATNTWRDYVVTFTSTTTATMQSIATGIWN